MSAVPSLLASAQTALQTGFALQHKAATEIVSAPLRDPLDPEDVASLRNEIGGTDPLEKGLLDTIRAQTLVSSGAALVHAYDPTTGDLFRLLDTSHSRRD